MKHSFDLENFESFLSEQADRHRMYANDRVWRNILKSIHGNDRWPALTFASILTLAFMAVVLTISYPNKQLNLGENLEGQQHIALEGFGGNPNNPSSPTPGPAQSGQDNPVMGPALIATAKGNEPERHRMRQNFHNAENLGQLAPVVKESATSTLEAIESGSLAALPEIPGQADDLVEPESAQMLTLVAGSGLSGQFTPSVLPMVGNPSNSLAPIENFPLNNTVRNAMAVGPSHIWPQHKKQSRWGIQLYATPSISYRYLLEDKKYVDDPSAINGPLAPYLTNSVNHFVKHKAKMGTEIGAAVLYRLTDNLRLKSGLQVNYRQYGIEAFATSSLQPAILALERDNGIDSVIRYTNISAQSGYKQIELSSNFLQLALPIGFDIKLGQANRFGFYVSAAGQLTWQLARNSYIISADYKNYLKQPSLDRKFNINTSIEAFVSYDAGGITWQAGPQIRYQLLPGSIKAYPVREHLVDYGLKVGIVKTLK